MEEVEAKAHLIVVAEKEAFKVRAMAMAAEELRELDVEAIAWSMMGIADFLGMRWVLWEGRLPPDSVIDSAIAMIRNGPTR